MRVRRGSFSLLDLTPLARPGWVEDERTIQFECRPPGPFHGRQNNERIRAMDFVISTHIALVLGHFLEDGPLKKRVAILGFDAQPMATHEKKQRRGTIHRIQIAFRSSAPALSGNWGE